MTLKESQIEQQFIDKLVDELKYIYRPDIRDKAALDGNFRAKFEALNQVQLTDAEFARLRDDIISANVFQAAKTLREYGYFQREDGTPLHYMLVNLKDWCKNHFEVIHQLRINTDSSHHRYDAILLVNGLPLVQIELKTLGITPRKAMEQIVEYKHDVGQAPAEPASSAATTPAGTSQGAKPKPTRPVSQRAVVEAVLDKHDAIALFSGEDIRKPREIWLVEPAPEVIDKLDAAVAKLETFMQSQGQPCTPEAVNNLKGDTARAEFINRLKEIERLKTQLDQYTDLTDAQQPQIEQRLPEETHRGFKGMYLETAQRLREQQRKPGESDAQKTIEQLEFEFVLFSSTLVD